MGPAPNGIDPHFSWVKPFSSSTPALYTKLLPKRISFREREGERERERERPGGREMVSNVPLINF